jgi:signal transduction histidine kinase
MGRGSCSSAERSSRRRRATRSYANWHTASFLRSLTRGGLRAGVDAVVTRLDLPVEVDIPAERFPAEIEASAYFIVAELLTNVVKHSHASRAEVRATVADLMLHINVRDDGIGGADPGGHGLVGIGDRVSALGGRLEIQSPAGAGTFVAATLQVSPA